MATAGDAVSHPHDVTHRGPLERDVAPESNGRAAKR